MRKWALIVMTVLLAAAAAVLVGMHLHLPYNTRAWTMDGSTAAGRADERLQVAMPAGDVNVNTASVEELQQLYGVGPAIAQAIVDEREANGWFYYPEDLINVKGIGQKTLEKMRNQLALP